MDELVLNSAKKHLRLYRSFFLIYLKTRLVYYQDALLGMVNQLFSLLSSLLIIGLIFTQVNSINGWSFWELIFLAGIGRFVLEFYNIFFFSPVFLGEQYIVTGRLDRYLVRPLNVLYQVYASRVSFHHLGDATASLLVVIYAAIQIDGNILNAINLFYSLFSLASAVMVIGSIFLLLASIGFWTGRTGSLFSLFWKIRKFRKYPFGIYSEGLKILFVTVIPIAFASFFQASYLLGKTQWFEFQLFSLVAGPVFYLVAYRFWLFGLRHYSSTGS